MDRPAPASRAQQRPQDSRPLEHLTPQERAVLHVLEAQCGRVLSRHEIARAAGLGDVSERRCDSLLVGVRRIVGPDRLRTVRRRGWMLLPDTSSS